ncbi:hypothetical protein tb265_36970 [Gemmatimonadetes bacterium T265]|nr:hypothetical protein tb265_36970 [Gemmatimonadetes bacterium T265]
MHVARGGRHPSHHGPRGSGSPHAPSTGAATAWTDESRMIARHDAPTSLDKSNLWSALAAPLDADAIAWRQEGPPVARDGGWYARYVAHSGANAVRERLDRVVPGEWDLTLELLPSLPARAGEPQECAFKARLQILGVIREDVGTGADYKSAANDALARAAVRFGIGHELNGREPNWVVVDGPDAAEPLDAPAAADARRAAAAIARRATAPAPARPAVVDAAPELTSDDASRESSSSNAAGDDPSCPKCSGRMWDNRLTKRNPKAPDFKCRDRSCDGVIWPPRPGESAEPAGAPADAPGDGSAAARGNGRAASRSRATTAVAAEPRFDAAPLGSPIDDDDLPF